MLLLSASGGRGLTVEWWTRHNNGRCQRSRGNIHYTAYSMSNELKDDLKGVMCKSFKNWSQSFCLFPDCCISYLTKLSQSLDAVCS